MSLEQVSGVSPHAGPKVSVVVPVFNPGRHIELCIESLLAQTLPPDQLELIFVDDGSTDDTPARLDTLAAEHPHITVIHQPNSGWSGRPRNVGTDAATGEYVQYVDQDDWLGTEALQRLYDYATANNSDVMLGRVVGNRMKAPGMVFEHSRPAVTIHDHGPTAEGDFSTGLIGTLTPHKMFRREFLIDNRIRFPEGPRRLEDHVFVVTAYFAAQRISVYADYDCYYHTVRDDRGNAGLGRMDPVGYFANLREALDVVDANTEPGAERDRLHSRWLRSEVIRRIRRPGWLSMPGPERQAMFEQMHGLVVERFSPSVERLEPELDGHVAGLIRRGDLDGLVEQLSWEAGLRATAHVERLEPTPDGLRLDVRVALLQPGGQPLSTRPGAPVPPGIEVTPGATVYARTVDRSTSRSLFVDETAWRPGSFDALLTTTLPATGLTVPETSAVQWEVFARVMLGRRTYDTKLQGSGGERLLLEESSGQLRHAPHEDPTRVRRARRDRRLAHHLPRRVRAGLRQVRTRLR